MSSGSKAKTEAIGARIRRRATRFLRDENGALIPLSIQIFLILMICTGVTIDFVRQEELRAKIQNTLDRATLAAASLSQELDPAAVVQDYLDKAGLGYLDVTPVVEEGDLNQWRRVTATANESMATFFGKLVSLDTLGVSATSTAEESIGNVEISLVLDISGSMNDSVSGGTRISKLRSAAVTFVDKMFATVQPASAPAGRLSISIVPYNQQVYLGAATAAGFNLSDDSSETAACADVETLPDGDFAISATRAIPRTMYGDSFDYWGQGFSLYATSATALNSGIGNCIVNSAASVLAWGNDKTTIDNKINALTAKGDTAIDVGARWGLALLDPAAQGARDILEANGTVSSDLAGRPFAYKTSTSTDEDSAMKVLVLMTDGENTRSYSTQQAYRTGASGFYSTRSATAFSCSVNTRNNSCSSNSDYTSLYYYKADHTTTTTSGGWWNQTTTTTSTPYYRLSDGKWYSAASVGTVYSVDWSSVWSAGYTLAFTIKYFLQPAFAAANGSSETTTAIYNRMAIQSEYTDKDNALVSLCNTAKDSAHGIYVFTVAVDAPDAGKAILKQCATNTGYAYDVTSSELTDAFASIASSINALRLTN